MKIDKNVPLAKPRAPWGALSKLFAQMEVGDSILIAGEDHSGKTAVAARIYFADHGMKSSARRVEGGIRVWRVA
jgi:DNA helicase TIP49 (TBP-interacting protein)